MKQHILETSKSEIEKNNETLQNHKIEGFKEKLRAFF